MKNKIDSTFGTLKGKKILITGATGLIGKALVNKLSSHGAVIIASVRNLEKANSIFNGIKNIEYLCSDIENMPLDNIGCQYIIHAASQTASSEFVNHPVELIKTAINGTWKVLEFAKSNPIVSMVYLSSMEVYGTPETDQKIYEYSGTSLDTMNVRSSYPESKRMCENLCTSYYSEFNIPIKVMRLTQTFGPGVPYNDKRVFAEFARCAIEGKDIVLKTKGETKRSYLYVDDAVNAIICVLLNGKAGEAYNAANEDTYCSIREMAELVATKGYPENNKVVIDIAEDVAKLGYAPTLHMNLDTTKLRNLGWKPDVNLSEMYDKLIAYMKDNRENKAKLCL